MYLAELKATVVKGLKDTFDNDFPEADFRGINITLEYPVAKTEYPAIWVDYDPAGPLRIVGIGHDEYGDAGAGNFNSLYRWNFAGSVSFTCAALSNLECDRLIDSMIRCLAFSRSTAALGALRSKIEASDLIGMNFDWDEVEQRGFSVSPGTPWGTDELIYEGTLAMEVVGEFTSTPAGVLVPVSEVEVVEFIMGDDDPTTPGGWIQEI